MKGFLLVAAAFALSSGAVDAAYLVSGTGSGSTYKTGYAPAVVEAISPATEAVFFGEVEDRDGKGTVSNLEVCAAETEDLCFGIGQGDVVAGSPQVASGDVCIIRSDLEAEYAFAFVDNSQLQDYADLRANWERGRITFYTSETSSGSLATLENLREAAGFDPGTAKIETLPDWDAVIQKVASDPRAVGFTVRYADPTGFLSELVDDHGFTVLGVAERAMRRLSHADGSPVYTVSLDVPYDTKGILGAGGMSTTPSLGAPVVLFGNCPDKLGDFAADAGDAHDAIRQLPASAFDVKLGWMADLQSKIADQSQQMGGDEAWAWAEDMATRTGDLIE
ncbi:MAG TPA: hypothetical protein VMM55_06015 [Thermohalobaculum sp.]|nr:hypothetical protein [Thermohalobaculum sp.]